VDSERIVRQLAAALPEAFEGRDVRRAREHLAWGNSAVGRWPA
jgi:hypothetical protein